MASKINKKAQVTIFVIAGLVLVIAIALVFFLRGNFTITQNPTENPSGFLDNCVQQSLKDSEELILATNGFPEKGFKNYFVYNSENIPFLCTTSEFYSTCVPQAPAFLDQIKNSIENKATLDLNECYRQLRNEYEQQGYSVTENSLNLEIKLIEDRIVVKVSKTFTYTKDEQSSSIKDGEYYLSSSLFNLIKLAQTITNYESSFCEFDEINWMRYNSDISILRFRASDQTKVYTLKDRITESELKFAIKTCVLPAGI